MEREEVRRLMAERFTKGGTVMNGLELRELRGERRGKREIVVKLLTKRFGPVSEAALAKLNALSSERLDEIAMAYTEAASLADLGLGEPSSVES